ncbi:hypothetical protein HPB48_013164 [Haemaphysalis longicornis]|uniref:Endonuclease/exonuclease/phosphatase domain-containing protein n=1 Tax=Haemaphysalis longicornis TaxID=44386 RepID=A0A9J6G8M6_HAELO|nr:hypothetical protein HPB48_013164 [Haemaphysalis longicornis]
MPDSLTRPLVSLTNLSAWQRNCRGFRRKRANLEDDIKLYHSAAFPDVIFLQEAGAFAMLQNYKSFSDLEEDTAGASSKLKPAVTTVVMRNLTAIHHETFADAASAVHVLVELTPTRKRDTARMFVFDV